ncbi:TonB-dependent receptor [Pseudoalteromonas porphyrae]|uniref:TonB-dependent receptor n=1 Tax=Pseudoalteromonas TaxID=53246 RepID=UPI0006BA9808|nr:MULTISPECIES: TonB-dependent receptor [Pseudoalteromonas]KPH96503.1 TonB-dependent receptor [Pseudoalteromonas porphyrae]
MKLRLSLITAALLPLLSAPAFAEDTDLEKILVTGDFQKESIQTLSASASLFSQQEINDRGANFLDEMLASAANVNFSSGASRGRFIQIRGVGLRSQFVDPINPSVGLVIDGINYSGLGGSSLLFDVNQIEIYRGPQGTRFGADGLGGMIQMESADPTFDPSVKVQLGAGNYNSYEAGIAAGIGITDSTAVRASIYQRESDGFMDNEYLGKPTQQQDEMISRFKLHSQLSDHLRTELSVHYIDINNGYDAFTLDNSRNSVADSPGQDNQESIAVGLANIYTGFDLFDVSLNLSGIDSELLYSFDEDWVCNDTSKPKLCGAGLHEQSYSYKDAYYRDRKDKTAELQFNGKAQDWITGIYYQNRNVGLDRQRIENSDLALFNSTYEVSNVAVYGQLATPINAKTTLITGLRVEEHSSDYSDSNGFIVSSDDVMVGGKVALEYQVIDRTMIYTSITRGYKAGGINSEALAKAQEFGLGADFFQQHTTFDPEYLWNAEFGVKGSSLDDKFVLRLAAFYMYREDMQLKSWLVEGQNFTSYFDNAGSGENYGLEIEGSYQLTDDLFFTGSVGYLDTKINDYVARTSLYSPPLDQDGREQAQAPKYQYAFTARYNFTDELFATVGIEGKDDYYFSDSHNSQASNVNLVNFTAGYEADQWSIRAWARNVFDEEAPTRGFEFANDPRDGWVTHTYTQQGEPMVAGVTFIYEL